MKPDMVLRKLHTHRVRAILTFAILITIVATSIHISNTKNSQPSTEKIIISAAQQPVMALIFVAEDKGYFREQGLDVTYYKHILGRDALADVLEGRADLATVYDIPTIRKIYEGEDVGILTSLHSSTRNHAIVSGKNKDIDDVEKLKGKKIAVTLGISTDFFLFSALENEGIGIDEITIVNTEPEQLIPTYERGDVDAVVLFNPYLQTYRRKHGDEMNFMYSDTYQDESLLVAKKDYILQNEEKIIRVLIALTKAENYIRANREDSIAIVDAHLTEYDGQQTEDIWDEIDISLGMDNLLYTTLRREVRFLNNLRIYEGERPNIRDYLMPEYLKKVYPEAVTLY